MRIEAVGKPPGCKLIRISAETSGAETASAGAGNAETAEIANTGGADDRIVFIRIRGDFFACPEERFDAVEEALAGTPVSRLAECFDSLIKLNNMETFGISGAAVAEVFNEGAGAKGADSDEQQPVA
ncbi:MAG: hypothetical protein LBF63_00210 [Treponema sp.]|nr:hypothetical protein [Treponema sp.]